VATLDAEGDPLDAEALAGSAGTYRALSRGGGGLSARRERALVRAAQRGDHAAVEGLFVAHWPRAYRAAWLIARDEHAAEDIAQESFLAALAALDRFDRARPFGPWLRTIVARRAIDSLRARALRREVGDASLEGVAARPAQAVAVSDRVLAAVAALPDDQRVVVVMRHLLELTPGEIAVVLDLPRGTVNSRLRRGLDALRYAIGEDRP
jgi:RNA polymerase sigma-70 factor (ECF subfamily)